jgi:hypothetical protein
MFTSRILGHHPEHIFNTEPVFSAGFDSPLLTMQTMKPVDKLLKLLLYGKYYVKKLWLFFKMRQDLP